MIRACDIEHRRAADAIFSGHAQCRFHFRQFARDDNLTGRIDVRIFPYTTLFRSAVRGCGIHRLATFAVGTVSTQPEEFDTRSEEHTSELQSPYDLVCRLLLEKKKKKK